MKVAVSVKDKEIKTVLFEDVVGMLFSKVIEIKSDGMLKPFLLLGEGGNVLGINVRSYSPSHLQCIIVEEEKKISFQFSGLEIGKERIQYVGNDIKNGWKFASGPGVVRVKKLED